MAKDFLAGSRQTIDAIPKHELPLCLKVTTQSHRRSCTAKLAAADDAKQASVDLRYGSLETFWTQATSQDLEPILHLISPEQTPANPPQQELNLLSDFEVRNIFAKTAALLI